MSGFLYGVALQWKLDIRSKSLLVTCYIVPLIFFLLMGGIFTSVMPEMRSTLIQSMIVMGVSMGRLSDCRRRWLKLMEVISKRFIKQMGCLYT